MSARGSRVREVLRNEGVVAVIARIVNRLLHKALNNVGRFLPPREEPGTNVVMLVKHEDARDVDWTTPQPWQVAPRSVTSDSIHSAWIMHPPGESSGGAQNIFRFIQQLEHAGHKVTIYFYSALHDFIDLASLESKLRTSPSYDRVNARFAVLDRGTTMPSDVDAIVATGWETAYPAFRDPGNARRIYFVQDFEPAFTAVGSEHVLAENTYRFGFDAITAGRWLSTKLRDEFGMRTAHYNFGADVSLYRYTNTGARNGVFFYARPVTPRRGFELGILALEVFAKQNPDAIIHLAGWDVSSYGLPFPHVDHGLLPISALSDIYNRCGTALVLSLTNMSLLPLELLAAGVIPVINAGPNNSLVSDNRYIEYVQPSPHAIANKLGEVLARPDAIERSAGAAASMQGATWQKPGEDFLAAFEKFVRD